MLYALRGVHEGFRCAGGEHAMREKKSDIVS
jgi:hypothetical protein